jgi:hypothetical protein
VDTVEGLRDAGRRARECAVVGHAVTLARWIGNGRRPVAAGHSPVGYWREEEPEEPEPFGLNEVNRRLAAPGREPV